MTKTPLNEEEARFLLAGRETESALTLEVVRRLAPDDVATLFAILRDGFKPRDLAHLLHLVSGMVTKRAEEVQQFLYSYADLGEVWGQRCAPELFEDPRKLFEQLLEHLVVDVLHRLHPHDLLRLRDRVLEEVTFHRLPLPTEKAQ